MSAAAPGSGGRPLRVHVIAEGDPEDPSASGSGTPASVIAHLRAAGAEVTAGDVELYGVRRALAMARTWSPRRARWVAKYHLAPVPYAARSANAVRAVRAARARGRVDAVLQYGGTFGLGAAPGVPHFLYCDSNTRLSSAEPRSWGAQLTPAQLEAAVGEQARVYRAATGIFTFSDYVRDSFVRDFAVAPERVTTVHAGPNFEVPAADPAVAAARLAGPPTVLFVGREWERKGGPVLLEAFRAARAEVPDARLLVAGPEALGDLGPGVEFLGYLRKSDPEGAARLRRAYERATAFALPTRHEPFGIVVLEAMFHALPVVATRIWAIPEMVVEGRTGYTVPRDDARALAARLVEILRDPARAAALGAAGREHALAHFTWDHVARRMLGLMAAAAAPGPAAPGAPAPAAR